MDSSQSRIPRYVSHASDDGQYEAVRDHLNEVSQMAAEFARPFGGEDWAALAGLAHDIGKYSEEFQDRILHGAGKVDHSTAGAFELGVAGAHQIAYCIAGHHGGLPNGGSAASDVEGGTLFARLRSAARKRIPKYEAFRSEVDLDSLIKGAEPPRIDSDERDPDSVWFSLQFFIRMLYSCLVDADYLCTERFMAGERARLACDSIPTLCEKLEKKLAGFYPPRTSLNKKRCGVLDACQEAGSWEPGVFSLTVPTGGGKTFASLRFALSHAVAHDGMRRVIYAIPYTSIIDQNAREFRQVLGAENVLEHHANFDFDDEGELGDRLRLASENWEAPVVVTTNVQLFESLFANKASRCRKLHNIAGSVIVLDEAQMIPTAQLVPCVRALVELVRNYGCSVVLCTATQPSLDALFERFGCSVREIVPDPQELFDSLERVVYRDSGSLSDDDLALRLGEAGRSLCVVNSRRQARRLYDLIKHQDGSFHLTTSMHPAHRERILAEIRDRLAAGVPCCVVATSLVEAGVNLDFPVVYRALAGIDSVVQAAGRCNREGLMIGKGEVFVFRPLEPLRIPRDVDQKQTMAGLVLHGVAEDPEKGVPIGDLGVIESYFRRLHHIRREELDAKGVYAMCCKAPVVKDADCSLWIRSIPFEDIAEAFSIIDDPSYTVIVAAHAPFDDVEALVGGFADRAAMRRLARYSVGVYEHDLKALLAAGAVEPVNGGVYVLRDSTLYSEEVGLDVGKIEEGKGIFL
ncbi:MAG TPA: CRISPR-associated helicase Cas3' [Candidatus Aphodovivens avistercoris]|nr:CRISPR-associated helicase Cas3' [Candidatus Aphodovivens avistercoris]